MASEGFFPINRVTSTAYWCPNRRSVRPRRIFGLCFSISSVTAPMNSRPGSTCKSCGHFKGPRLKIFFKALATSAESFEVKGSASLKRLATSTTVKAYYLYVFLPRPRHTESFWRKRRSAWWTTFGVDTSNLGRGMCFGAGRYICRRACHIRHFFAASSETSFARNYGRTSGQN